MRELYLADLHGDRLRELEVHTSPFGAFSSATHSNLFFSVIFFLLTYLVDAVNIYFLIEPVYFAGNMV